MSFIDIKSAHIGEEAVRMAQKKERVFYERF